MTQKTDLWLLFLIGWMDRWPQESVMPITFKSRKHLWGSVSQGSMQDSKKVVFNQDVPFFLFYFFKRGEQFLFLFASASETHPFNPYRINQCHRMCFKQLRHEARMYGINVSRSPWLSWDPRGLVRNPMWADNILTNVSALVRAVHADLRLK